MKINFLFHIKFTHTTEHKNSYFNPIKILIEYLLELHISLFLEKMLEYYLHVRYFYIKKIHPYIHRIKRTFVYSCHQLFFKLYQKYRENTCKDNDNCFYRMKSN